MVALDKNINANSIAKSPPMPIGGPLPIEAIGYPLDLHWQCPTSVAGAPKLALWSHEKQNENAHVLPAHQQKKSQKIHFLVTCVALIHVTSVTVHVTYNPNEQKSPKSDFLQGGEGGGKELKLLFP